MDQHPLTPWYSPGFRHEPLCSPPWLRWASSALPQAFPDALFRWLRPKYTLGNASFRMCSGPRFNIKMTSYQYRKSHCGDKTILRPSYLHNGISYTGKTTSLYWIRALGSHDHLEFSEIFQRPLDTTPAAGEHMDKETVKQFIISHKTCA